jgi:hypothetical protein
MRILHKEVHIYREDNEKIMKYREEILKSMNMLQRQVNKFSGTKKETSSIQVTTSRSHSRKDDHGIDRKSRSMSTHHHSPRKSTSIPSVSPIRIKRSSIEKYIL